MATTLSTRQLLTYRLCEAGLQRLEFLAAHALLNLQRVGRTRGVPASQWPQPRHVLAVYKLASGTSFWMQAP